MSGKGEKESCIVELYQDQKYGWKLKVSDNCSKVIKDINQKLGEYGRRYFENRLIIESRDTS